MTFPANVKLTEHNEHFKIIKSMFYFIGDITVHVPSSIISCTFLKIMFLLIVVVV